MKNPNQIIALKAVDYVRLLSPAFLAAAKWAMLAVWAMSGAALSIYSFPIGQKIAVAVLGGPAAVDHSLLSGLFLVGISLWSLCVLLLAFVRQKLMRLGRNFGKNGAAPGSILEYFDFDAAKIYKKTLAYPHLPFDRLLLYRILSGADLSFALARLQISKNDLKKKLLAAMKEGAKSFSRTDSAAIENLNKERRREIFESARTIAFETGNSKITFYALFLALAERDADFQKTMDVLELAKEDVADVVLWQARRQSYRDFREKFWERDNLRRALAASPVKMAVGGYTVLLDRYSHDVALDNPLRQGGVVLHTREIKQLEEALIKRRGGGVLLVGENGSGRKSIVYNFSNRVVAEEGPAALKMVRILEVNMVALIGNNPGKAALAEVLGGIFTEAIRAKNVILVIPQINNYIGRGHGGDAVAMIDISGVIGTYLKRPKFRLIGITDYEGLHRSIEQAGEIAAQFTKIEVARVSIPDTMRVLKEEGLRREKDSSVFIPYATLKEVAKLCDYFQGDMAFPQKAVNLLDDLIINRVNYGGREAKIISPADVDEYFSGKYQVPAGAAGQREKDILVNLEARIHEGLINQKEAVKELANAMRRARAEIKKRRRTIGNFLFLGPTGVGKTETAKQLARVYFGSEKNMIRLNMSEYQTMESMEKLIGGAAAPGVLTTAVRDNPFSIILVDEIEKAHSELLNIFLNIFDEGEMSDGMGRTVDFKHTIIIATSNAGAGFIKEAIEKRVPLDGDFKELFIDRILREGVFAPEFINRFDAVALYRPLDVAECRQIAGLMLKKIQKGLAAKGIAFQITDDLAAALADIGFDPVFGGRAMRRAVQNKVENAIASGLLSESIKPGDAISINSRTWQIETETPEK